MTGSVANDSRRGPDNRDRSPDSPATLRAFIAVELPDDVKEFIAGLQAGLRRSGLRMRWVRPGNLHLTLRFLGNVAAEECEAAAVAMRQAGDWEVYGVEPREAAAKEARAVSGAEVRVGTIGQAQWPSEHFDVVTLWDVLEHVPDPMATLRETHRVLRPGGIVLARVPNGGSWEARLFGLTWAGSTGTQSG